MCSDWKLLTVAVLLILSSCSSYRRMEKIRNGEVGLVLSIPDEVVEEPEEAEVVIDSIRGELSDGPLIMNAIKDTETGEMVATDVIRASKVVARFRNVAERAGYVSVGFDVIVPAAMAVSDWQLKMYPFMTIMDDCVPLDPLFITGENYRGKQLRGYERYNAFLASIITDPEDFVKIGQLEIFLRRHFPDTYAMKSDSSFVSDPEAENVFGVTQREAFEHYRRQLRWKLNERRKNRLDDMYGRYVKDPIVKEGVRLDTVLTSLDGDFLYRYSHTFRSRPGLKKVGISLKGKLYEDGECFLELPFPDELTFYISSLTSLADDISKYRMIVRSRRVYDNTKAFIDFATASAVIDTSLSDNASELERIRNCIQDVVSREEFALDSLVITASCSPEGSYALNTRLSAERSRSVRKYIEEFVPYQWRDSLRTSVLPENWDQLLRLVESDTVLTSEQKRKIISLSQNVDEEPDEVEYRLSQMKEYVYLRERIYPKLRTVSFNFHLHRVGMVKDTVHTTEPDTVYMAGLQAIKNMDYKKAVTLLRPYDDYNSALAFMCADYNHSALDVLGRLDDTDPRVCYLKAVVLARLENKEEALKYYELALAYDPRLEFRANLDPEMYEIVKLRQNKNL